MSSSRNNIDLHRKLELEWVKHKKNAPRHGRQLHAQRKYDDIIRRSLYGRVDVAASTLLKPWIRTKWIICYAEAASSRGVLAFAFWPRANIIKSQRFEHSTCSRIFLNLKVLLVRRSRRKRSCGESHATELEKCYLLSFGANNHRNSVATAICTSRRSQPLTITSSTIESRPPFSDCSSSSSWAAGCWWRRTQRPRSRRDWAKVNSHPSTLCYGLAYLCEQSEVCTTKWVFFRCLVGSSTPD